MDIKYPCKGWYLNTDTFDIEEVEVLRHRPMSSGWGEAHEIRDDGGVWWVFSSQVFFDLRAAMEAQVRKIGTEVNDLEEEIMETRERITHLRDKRAEVNRALAAL
jgi:hypothetical protein